jgi:hypothetical protein
LKISFNYISLCDNCDISTFSLITQTSSSASHIDIDIVIQFIQNKNLVYFEHLTWFQHIINMYNIQLVENIQHMPPGEQTMTHIQHMPPGEQTMY